MLSQPCLPSQRNKSAALLSSFPNDCQHFRRCHNKRLHGKMSQVPSDSPVLSHLPRNGRSLVIPRRRKRRRGESAMPGKVLCRGRRRYNRLPRPVHPSIRNGRLRPLASHSLLHWAHTALHPPPAAGGNRPPMTGCDPANLSCEIPNETALIKRALSCALAQAVLQ